jgi:hypothetical protein
MSTSPAPATIVLVHGGFVDGSGWRAVHELLKADGYTVRVVQNPTLTLEGDAAAARWVMDAADAPGCPGRALLRRRGDHRGRRS